MVKKGILVIIPANTEIRSTHPQKDKIISRRAQNVITINNEKDYLTWCSRVEWGGSGGYWRWADITDEILDANPKLKELVDQRKKNEAEENARFMNQRQQLNK